MMFRNYEYFVAIAEAGSLTRAAEILYVSQPSLSQYLRRLESELGVELFNHRTSPLKLTYTGERYYESVKQMMRLEENIKKEFQDIKNQESGCLRLGIAFWRGACLLPDIFPEFHRQYPGIRIELMEDHSDKLALALMNGKLDIAVMNLPHTLDYRKLTSDIIFEERILLAAPTRHPYIRTLLDAARISDGYPIAPAKTLLQLPLIKTKPGQNLTHEINHILGKHHIEPEILLETGNLTTAINLVATGIACTLVPEEGAKVCNHPGNVTYFALDLPDLSWSLAAVYQKDAYLTHLAQLFVESLKASLCRIP